jgi:uncharacterized protein YqgV (UPF0045/DUF77 family)
MSVIAMLAGCAGVGGSRPVETPVGATVESLQAAQLASYVNALQTVVQGSPAEQAEILAAARRGYEQARQGPASLRYALLLAAPGHPAREPQTALGLLQDARAHPELLSPVERALAIVETARVEQELGLAAENTRLIAEAQQERDRQRVTPPSVALARQLKTEMDENARLRKELEDAKAKLEAIANIERSIPARPPATEARKP